MDEEHGDHCARGLASSQLKVSACCHRSGLCFGHGDRAPDPRPRRHHDQRPPRRPGAASPAHAPRRRRRGHVLRATARLGYTQSAVSQQIAALERMLGTPLFDRPGGPRPVELTEAGRAMVDHARGVLGRLDLAQAELAAISAGEQGTVGRDRAEVGTRVLPALLTRFRDRHPGVEVIYAASPTTSTSCSTPSPSATSTPPSPRSGATAASPTGTCSTTRSCSSPRARPRRPPSQSVTLEELLRLPMIGYRDGACRAVVEEMSRRPPRCRRSCSGPTTTRPSRDASPPASATGPRPCSPSTSTTRPSPCCPSTPPPSPATSRWPGRPAGGRRPPSPSSSTSPPRCAGTSWRSVPRPSGRRPMSPEVRARPTR